MKIFDGLIYRNATPEEEAKNKAFNDETRQLLPTDVNTKLYIDNEIAEVQALILEH